MLQFWPLGIFMFVHPLTNSQHCGTIVFFLTFWHKKKSFGFKYYLFTYLSFLQGVCFPILENDIRNKIWLFLLLLKFNEDGVFTASRSSAYRTRRDTCVSISWVYAHVYKYCCSSLCFMLAKHEIVLMFPTPDPLPQGSFQLGRSALSCLKELFSQICRENDQSMTQI